MAGATTDEDGRYELGTFGLNDGAIVGAHRVTVIARGERLPRQAQENSGGNPLMPSAAGKPRIPVRYFDASTSGLAADVQQVRMNTFDFDLRSAQDAE